MKIGKRTEFLSCRDVLWYMVFCGFAINYMLRINLNLTIVAMVTARPKAAAAIQCGDTTAHLWNNDTLDNATDASTIAPFNTSTVSDVSDELRFSWTEYEQGLALGAYYWLHWLSQLPGGLLARRYGTKFVYGSANLLTALLGLIIPFATRYHLYALVVLRALQGLVAGVVWPSMHDMTAKWIPPNERSRFVSAYLDIDLMCSTGLLLDILSVHMTHRCMNFLGSSVGAAITYPLCAAVSNWLGWGAAFYVTSLLGVIWYCFWLFLVYDSPQQHPRISDHEKKYIIENLSDSVNDQETEIPWKSIFLSGPVWITIIAQWGGAWGFLTLMTQAPSYFNFVHGWNINATGILAGVPHILRMIFSYFFSIMSDWLLRSGRMTLTNVRKLATFVCCGIQGILILALGYSGCQPILAVFFMMTGTAVNGAVSASTLANFVDLSPNYASVLLGFCGMIVIWAGFLSPAVVGILTNNNQTVGQWRLVFIIAAVNSIVGTIVYQFFGTSDEQPWNQQGKLKHPKSQEMQKMPPRSEMAKCEDGTNVKERKEDDKLLPGNEEEK